MGLYISAYRGLQAVTGAELDQDGHPVDENLWLASHPMIAFTMENWPTHSCAEAFHFRAQSSTGFGLWRDALARLVLHIVAEQVSLARAEGPFVELIDFADNEGMIGPRGGGKARRGICRPHGDCAGPCLRR